ncbi:hypothetical protein H6F89_30345 [Cyanobacteria bacterium FACHB-63]|nr:hypothetical protein [Cyanobacteria bacterium FACHB-63]
MTEQQQQSQQEQTIEQRLDNLQDQYIKFNVQQTFGANGGDESRFDEVWSLVKNGVELTEDHTVKINGKPSSEFFKAFGASKDLREKYFQPEFKLHPSQAETEQKPRKQAEPEVLYVSEAQLNDRSFMRQSGPKILKAIQDNRVQVDAARAVKSGHEIREFLEPKQPDPQVSPQISPTQAAKSRTTQISKNDLMRRSVLLKLNKEWEDAGGVTGAIQKGLITVV